MIYLRHALVLVLTLMGFISDFNRIDVHWSFFLFVFFLYVIFCVLNWNVPIFNVNKEVKDKIIQNNIFSEGSKK